MWNRVFERHTDETLEAVTARQKDLSGDEIEYMADLAVVLYRCCNKARDEGDANYLRSAIINLSRPKNLAKLKAIGEKLWYE